MHVILSLPLPSFSLSLSLSLSSSLISPCFPLTLLFTLLFHDYSDTVSPSSHIPLHDIGQICILLLPLSNITSQPVLENINYAPFYLPRLIAPWIFYKGQCRVVYFSLHSFIHSSHEAQFCIYVFLSQLPYID